jgi:hypothetical protein
VHCSKDVFKLTLAIFKEIVRRSKFYRLRGGKYPYGTLSTVRRYRRLVLLSLDEEIVAGLTMNFSVPCDSGNVTVSVARFDEKTWTRSRRFFNLFAIESYSSPRGLGERR